MDNNYPSAFHSNCIGDIPCNKHNRGCVNNKSKIIRVNNKSIPMEESYLRNNKKVNIVRKAYNNQLNSTQNMNTTTTHCLPYEPPSKVIDSNEVDFPTDSSHFWCNQRGYGNVVIATYGTCNNIYGKVNPWNRIPQLSDPYTSPADIKMAWAWNK